MTIQGSAQRTGSNPLLRGQSLPQFPFHQVQGLFQGKPAQRQWAALSPQATLL